MTAARTTAQLTEALADIRRRLRSAQDDLIAVAPAGLAGSVEAAVRDAGVREPGAVAEYLRSARNDAVDALSTVQRDISEMVELIVQTEKLINTQRRTTGPVEIGRS